jgi:phosphopantetheinyl transferase (holo-ACP synthase)
VPPLSGGTPAPALRGLGLDAETAARFERHAGADRRLTSVWTPRELDHAAAQADPGRALCASFCCKEAVFKAAGGGVRFTTVELLARRLPDTLPVAFAADAAAPAGAGAATVRLEEAPGGEIVAVVALHAGPARPPGTWPWAVALERIPLAASAAGLAALLARDFDETERRALAGRPDASVLGRLAAKRAILRALGPAARGASPADLVIERAAGGPPRLAARPSALPDVLFSISHSRTAAYAVAALAACPGGAPGVQSAP